MQICDFPLCRCVLVFVLCCFAIECAISGLLSLGSSRFGLSFGSLAFALWASVPSALSLWATPAFRVQVPRGLLPFKQTGFRSLALQTFKSLHPLILWLSVRTFVLNVQDAHFV